MDNLSTYAFLGITFYIAVIIAIGWLSGRSKDHENFVIGGRSVGILATASSIGAGWRDIAFLSFWLSISYTSGWAIYTLWIGSILSMVLIANKASVFRDVASKKKYIVPSEIINDYIGRISEKVYTFLLLFNCVFFVSAQLFVMSLILSSILGMDSYVSIGLTATVILFYLWRGGYGGVILTDIIQFFLLLLILILPFILDVNVSKVMDWKTLGNLGWAETLAIMIFPFFWNPPSPDVWQKIFAAKNKRTIHIAFPLGAFFAAVVTFSVVYLGISLNQYVPNADPNSLITLIFTEEIFNPLVVSGLLVLVFAMGMSSIDTWAYAFSSTFLRKILNIDQKNREQYIEKNRLITIIFLFSACLFAVSSENLMSLLMGIASVYAIAAPLFYSVIFKIVPKSGFNDKVLATITLLSFILFLYMHFTGKFGTSFVLSLIPVLSGFITIVLYGFYARRVND